MVLCQPRTLWPRAHGHLASTPPTGPRRDTRAGRAQLPPSGAARWWNPSRCWVHMVHVPWDVPSSRRVLLQWVRTDSPLEPESHSCE